MKTMRIGLPFSAAVHASVIFATVIALPPPEISEPDPYIFIPVELVTISDQTNIQAATGALNPLNPMELNPSLSVELPGAATAPMEEQTQAPELLPEPEPDPEVVPEKPPETLDPQKAAKDTEPLPKKQPQPNKAKPPVVEPDLEDTLGSLGPFVDRSKRERPNPRVNPGAQPRQGGGPAQAGTGAQSDMTVTVKDLIRARLEKCWSPPVDQPEPKRLKVQVSFDLNRDGTLVPNSERIVQPARLNPADRPMLIATERALNAVRACSPFVELVSLPYDGWRTVNFPFDPSAMVQ